MNMRLPILSFISVLATASLLKAADPAVPSTPVAKIGDQVLTEEQMNNEIGMALFEAQNQAYNAKRTWIERKTREFLFEKAAKDAKMTMAKWRETEIEAKIVPPTEDEISQIVQQMSRGQVPTDPAKLIEMRNQAKGHLMNQKRSSREAQLTQELKAGTPVEIFVTRPETPKIPLYGKNNPVKGPADAPVTIVEFTDFQCPWCSRAQETIQQVLKAYPDKIKFVTRHFPLTQIHPDAWPAAEASACVQEQGKFWEYHDKLFANQQQLKAADLARMAKEVGANDKKFDACVKSGRTRSIVETDQADGQSYGVTGTPTFFVNNQKVGFNQLMDTVKSILENK